MSVGAHAEHAKPSLSDERPWLARLARVGMLAPGLLYMLVGWLAIMLALGHQTGNPSRKGALHEVAGHTWGMIALGALAAGFAGYALWRFAVAALGEKIESREDLNVWKRLWYVARGLLYVAACWTTIQVMENSTGSSDTATQRDKTAEVLTWPAGRWLVAAAGIGVVAYGAGSIYRGVTGKFADDLKLGQIRSTMRKWFCRAGTFGWCARGVVLGLIGAFLVKAAIEFDPKESKGIDATLATLAEQPFGRFLLAVVALGLISFGLFYFVRARYREV
jgi:hypothetical protein